MFSEDDVVRNVLPQLGLSEEQLLIRLGKQIAPHGIGSDADDFDDEHYKDLGKTLLSRVMEHARQRICESEEVRITVTKLGGYDKIALAAPIADVIATIVNGPAVFTATAAIIVVGLHSYCESYWSKRQN